MDNYSGKWHLPKKKTKYAGMLIFDDENKRILLEIVGKKHIGNEPLFEKGPRGPQYNTTHTNRDFQEKHLLIIGEARHQKFTLYNCHFFTFETLGPDISKIIYEVEFVFFNIHVTSMSKFKINSALVKFPYLIPWYCEDSTDRFKEFGINIQRQPNPFVKKKRDDLPIDVTKRLQLTFIDDYDNKIHHYQVHHSLKYQKLLQFRYPRSVTFDTLREDMRIFTKLLEFSVGKRIRKKLLFLEADEKFISKGSTHFDPDKRIGIGNYSLHRGGDVEQSAQHSRYMLISKSFMEQEELESVMRKWYANTSYYPIYDIYIDTNNWFEGKGNIFSTVMFNNRFLNIIQALEAFHKKTIFKEKKNPKASEAFQLQFEQNKKAILSTITDKKLKEWCNSNLKYKVKSKLQPSLDKSLVELFESVKDITTELFGENQIINLFPPIATKLRNDLSHGVHEKTDQGKLLIPFYQMGQIVLAICILKSLDAKDIKYKISHYDLFERYIYEIKRTVIVPKKARKKKGFSTSVDASK